MRHDERPWLPVLRSMRCLFPYIANLSTDGIEDCDKKMEDRVRSEWFHSLKETVPIPKSKTIPGDVPVLNVMMLRRTPIAFMFLYSPNPFTH